MYLSQVIGGDKPERLICKRYPMNSVVACGAIAMKNAQIVKAAATTAPTARPNPQTLSFMAYLLARSIAGEIKTKHRNLLATLFLLCLLGTRLHPLRHLLHHGRNIAHHLRH